MRITTKYNVGDIVWIWYSGYSDNPAVVTRTIVVKVETNTSDKGAGVSQFIECNDSIYKKGQRLRHEPTQQKFEILKISDKLMGIVRLPLSRPTMRIEAGERYELLTGEDIPI